MDRGGDIRERKGEEIASSIGQVAQTAVPALFAVGLAAVGCTTIHENDYVQGPDYEPENVYRSPLSTKVKRVALYPWLPARTIETT